MFKVMIKRTVPQGMENILADMITQLRVAVSGQKGYISGETLVNTKKTNEYLVISNWDKETDWENWLSCEQRKNIQSKIDGVLGKETVYETYEYPHKVL